MTLAYLFIHTTGTRKPYITQTQVTSVTHSFMNTVILLHVWTLSWSPPPRSKEMFL